MRTRAPSHAIGRVGSSESRRRPAASAKRMSRGDFCTITVVPPARMRSSVFASSIFTGGRSGVSITAQEESLEKVPRGATRTRITPSRNAVMRTRARPAAKATPSLSFSTRSTAPTCCQPSADAQVHQRSAPREAKARRSTNPTIPVLPRRLILPRLSISWPTWGVRSSGKPILKERGSFCSLDAASDGVHYAAANDFGTVKRQPVGEVHIDGLARQFDVGLANLEEALLKNDSHDLVAEQLLGASSG